MKCVIGFQLVLILQLCYLLDNANSNYYDPYYDHPDQESQTQEENSEVEQSQEHHHHTRDRDLNTNHNYYEYNRNRPMVPYDEEDECNSCACNKCENPPECCKKVCESCPKPKVPHVHIIPMPPVPQVPIPMQQIPQMPQMQPMLMNQMPMPMPANSYPFQAQYPNQNLMYLPILQLMDLIKNLTTSEPKEVTTVETTTVTPTTTAATTTTQTTTTQATTTPATTTEATTTTPKPIIRIANEDEIEFRLSPNRYITSQRDKKRILESILKSAVGNFSNIILKKPTRPNGMRNKYAVTSLRRTKPTWMPKYGIVQIPDSMAEKLMSQLHDGNGNAIRRRSKVSGI